MILRGFGGGLGAASTPAGGRAGAAAASAPGPATAPYGVRTMDDGGLDGGMVVSENPTVCAKQAVAAASPHTTARVILNNLTMITPDGIELRQSCLPA